MTTAKKHEKVTVSSTCKGRWKGLDQGLAYNSGQPCRLAQERTPRALSTGRPPGITDWTSRHFIHLDQLGEWNCRYDKHDGAPVGEHGHGGVGPGEGELCAALDGPPGVPHHTLVVVMDV